MEVPFKRLPNAAGLPLPAYQSDGAAGMDLPAAVDADVTIEPGEVKLIPCGFAVTIPRGFEGQIRPRSGLAGTYGVTVLNSPGTIDADYRGEVKVVLINHGNKPFVVKRGMRIAQMMIAPVERAKWKEVEDLPATVRGEEGYGHTGV